MPGIVFLSGGQSDEQATARLNAMNQLGPHPWQLSFSYGRALQAAALKAWKGERGQRRRRAAAFLHRARMNSLRAVGRVQRRPGEGCGLVLRALGPARHRSACPDRRRRRRRDRRRPLRPRGRHAWRRRRRRAQARREGVAPARVPRRRGHDERGRRRRRGQVLVVSQFTLYGEHRARPAAVVGRMPRHPSRPNHSSARSPTRSRDLGATVATGRFGADMQVELVNDGPVTLAAGGRTLRASRHPNTRTVAGTMLR